MIGSLNLYVTIFFTITFIVWFFIIKDVEIIKKNRENELNDLNNFIIKKMKEVNKSNYYELKHIEGLEFKKEEMVYAKILENKLEIGNSHKKEFLDFDKIKIINFDIKEEEYKDVISNILVTHTFLWSELKLSYSEFIYLYNKKINKIPSINYLFLLLMETTILFSEIESIGILLLIITILINLRTIFPRIKSYTNFSKIQKIILFIGILISLFTKVYITEKQQKQIIDTPKQESDGNYSNENNTSE